MHFQVRVGPSRIAGQGLFTEQDIPAGSVILPYQGEKIASAERARRLAAGNAYIFHLNYRYAIDGQSLENIARYINHSCEPNCTVDRTGDTLWVVACRAIAAGEELSFNYGYDMQHYQANPCACGARTCCGYILDPQYWEHLRGAPPRPLPEPRAARPRPGPGPKASPAHGYTPDALSDAPR
ncbi:MAG: SET domain-containing protein [Candidatus Tectimicrobiota bacterium]